MRARLRINAIFWAVGMVVLACSGAAPDPAGAVDGGLEVQANDVSLKFTLDVVDVATDDDVPDPPDSATQSDDAAPDEAVAADVDTADDVLSDPLDVQCQPACGIHVCGDDGCGGSCGTCADKLMCSVGQCTTDPKLGCAGLNLPPNWKGSFTGDMTFSILGLIPTKAGTKGDLSFAITCLNSKFLVNGTMSGTASSLNPFTLKISGTYDPTTLKIDGAMTDGDVTVFLVVEYLFGGTIGGTLDGTTNTFTGTWDMATTSMKLLGSMTAGQIVPLTGTGTWTALGGP